MVIIKVLKTKPKINSRQKSIKGRHKKLNKNPAIRHQTQTRQRIHTSQKSGTIKRYSLTRIKE